MCAFHEASILFRKKKEVISCDRPRCNSQPVPSKLDFWRQSVHFPGPCLVLTMLKVFWAALHTCFSPAMLSTIVFFVAVLLRPVSSRNLQTTLSQGTHWQVLAQTVLHPSETTAPLLQVPSTEGFTSYPQSDLSGLLIRIPIWGGDTCDEVASVTVQEPTCTGV